MRPNLIHKKNPDIVRPKSLIIHPRLPASMSAHLRSDASQLREIEGLAQAIDLAPVDSLVVAIKRPRATSLIGTGKIDEIKAIIIDLGIELIIINASLTPSQQRNLEQAWHVKILDRTGLILEIFGARAHTHDARLQVELAQLAYQKSRLVRSWTHLERQRGGAGFMGGPGERQIESDRRQISGRITKLKKQLKDVRQRRGRMRMTRQNASWPSLALVGYTNAGKSTLFNRLTHEKKPARNILFDTLDPTMRAIDLQNGRGRGGGGRGGGGGGGRNRQQAILCDTVGFVSDLPHHLVAAFRATLEEVSAADVIIHVRDISHPDTLAQKHDVEVILKDLLKDMSDHQPPIIEVLNKIDLDKAQKDRIDQGIRKNNSIALSAMTGQGVEGLLARISDILSEKMQSRHFRVALDSCQVQAEAFLYEKGQVLHQSYDRNGALCLDVMLPAHAEGMFCKRFGDILHFVG